MGSYLDDGERVQIVCEDALDKAGLVVAQSGVATAGNVKLVDADKEKPYGVALKSTKNPMYGISGEDEFLTDQEITVIKRGVVECILASDNAAIAVGDYLMAVADGAGKEGVVDKLTIRTDSVENHETDLAALVGIALEAKAANAGATYGTKIKVLLKLLRS